MKKWNSMDGNKRKQMEYKYFKILFYNVIIVIINN